MPLEKSLPTAPRNDRLPLLSFERQQIDDFMVEECEIDEALQTSKCIYGNRLWLEGHKGEVCSLEDGLRDNSVSLTSSAGVSKRRLVPVAVVLTTKATQCQ